MTSTCTCGCASASAVTEADACGCGCSAPAPPSREEQIRELRDLREKIDARLSELQEA